MVVTERAGSTKVSNEETSFRSLPDEVTYCFGSPALNPLRRFSTFTDFFLRLVYTTTRRSFSGERYAEASTLLSVRGTDLSLIHI